MSINLNPYINQSELITVAMRDLCTEEQAVLLYFIKYSQPLLIGFSMRTKISNYIQYENINTDIPIDKISNFLAQIKDIETIEYYDEYTDLIIKMLIKKKIK